MIGCDSVRFFPFKGVDACLNNSNVCVVAVRWAADAEIVPLCPESLTLECGAAENDSLIAAWLDEFDATDACSDIDTTYNSYDSLGFNPVCGGDGMQVVTFTAFDTCGNSATCQATITIVDTTDPVLTCADDKTVSCDSLIVWDDPVSVTDNCDTAVAITVLFTGFLCS